MEGRSIKEIIEQEIVNKLKDGQNVNVLPLNGDVHVVLVTRNIPLIDRVILIDQEYNQIIISEVILGGIFDGEKELGVVQ
jgi:hypothetical protein